MTGFAARPLGARLSRIKSAVLLPSLLVAFACGSASAQAAAPTAPVSNSSLDSLLFYQLLIGELELTAGRVGNAYGVILDAARRHGDEVLFQRAVEIALQARAGDQALDAVRVWRSAKPKSTAAMRYQVQILLAVNRADDAIEPVGELTADRLLRFLNEVQVRPRPPPSLPPSLARDRYAPHPSASAALRCAALLRYMAAPPCSL